MAQSVKCPASDFGSGRDLMGGRIKPHIWLCTQQEGCSIFSPPLFLPLPLLAWVHSLSNKYF